LEAQVNQALETIAKRLISVVSKRESFAIALIGEAGLGKSFQLDQLLNNLACRSVSLSANASGPVLARSFARHDRVPAWAARSLERLESGETLEAARLADAITAYLVSCAPFVLRLEDLFEANPTQLEVWAGVARSLKGTRGVSVLAAGRGLPPDSFEHVRLESLNLLASREMLEQQIGAELPEAALTWIQARANGNPLFTLEYFRFLARSGFLWSDARRWRWRDPGSEVMPTSVEALVAQAIEPLRADPLLEAVLQARAILPDDQLERWAAVAQLPIEQLKSLQDKLELDGVLRDGALPAIVSTVIRATLEPAFKQALARRAIHVLEQDFPAFAALLIDDANLEPNEAIALLERGASSSMLNRSERQAASFLVQAAERAAPSERAWRSLLAARALQPFDSEEALRLVRLAGALEPNDQTTLLEAELLAAQGRFLEAERCAKRLEPTSTIRWLEVLLEARYRLDDDAGVLEIWESHPGLQTQAGVALRVRVGYALTQLGRFDQARELYQKILETTLSAEDRAWVLSAAAIVELDAGDLSAAANGFSVALEAFDALKNPSSEMLARRVATLANRSMVRYRLGQFTTAIQDLELVLVHHSQNGDGRSFAEAQTNLGTYLIAQAEFERAEEVLLEARAVLERITVGSGHKGENPRRLSLAEQGLVQLYLEWGPPHGAALALRHAMAAERAARAVQNPANLAQTLFYCAWAEAVHGRPERAHSMSDELEALAGELGLEPMRVLANWLHGLAGERLGRIVESLERIQASSDHMAALGHRAYAQRLALELDRMRNDADGARARGQDLLAFPGWMAVARRYFPETFASKELLPTKPLAKPNGKVTVRASESNQAREHLPRLNVLGTLRLEINNETITPPALQGKILLAVLLEARVTGRDGVKTLELLDALYPEYDESRGLGALKQLVFRIRASLGKSAVLRLSDGYSLGTLETDAETFLSTGATHLWRGPVLSDLSEDIASGLRDALAQALELCVESLPETDPQEAVRLAEIMRESDPYDQQALRHHLRVLEIGADLRKLERTYAQAREQLSEVGEDLPESWREYLQQA
jgi:tetratricopeptide (TPR) repeat protein